MMNNFYAGFAEILQIETSLVNPSLILSQQEWDSLAIVSTIALIDEHFDVIVSGQSLSKCQTLAEVERLIMEQRSGALK